MGKPTWQLTKVRNKNEVIAEERTKEVKEAEPRKSEKSKTKEATETKADAMAQKSDAEEAAARTASAALTAAADGQTITKSHAAASVGTVASEAQETKGKDNEILALIHERKTIAKHEKE